MEKDYQKLFQGLEAPRMSEELCESVLLRIDNEAQRISRNKLAIFVPLVFVSIFAVIASFQYLARETVQSGLSEYISIIFSDGDAMVSYWKEFLISLAEAAPIFGLTLFFGAVLALAGSLKAAFRNAQTVFTHIPLAN